jgi:hypothetical protein
VSNSLLQEDNRHAASCGDPPIIRGNDPQLYIGQLRIHPVSNGYSLLIERPGRRNFAEPVTERRVAAGRANDVGLPGR